MSNNDYVAPIDHGALSATGSVAVGTAGGAVKSIGKTALWCIAIGAAVGLTGGLGLLSGLAAESGAGLVIGAKAIFGALAGALGGGVVAAGLAPIVGAVGAGKGAMDSHKRVNMERGAAREMQAQLSAYRAVAASQPAYNPYPQQGTQYNPAGNCIAGIQNDGTIVGRQRQLGA